MYALVWLYVVKSYTVSFVRALGLGRELRVDSESYNGEGSDA